MFFEIFIFLYINKWFCCFACDLFVASKCPLTPATNDYNLNATAYCKNIKDHVDCINKKLKLCKNVQEFGPALETIKWSLKVTISQGSNHGCENLIDKIKLPRIPRKKLSTTAAPSMSNVNDVTQTYIDPNCNLKLVDLNCGKLVPSEMNYFFNNANFNESLVIMNDLNCKNYIKYNTCVQKNFRLKCQETFKQIFYKFEKVTSSCATILNTKIKTNIRTTQNSCNNIYIDEKYVFIYLFIINHLSKAFLI